MSLLIGPGPLSRASFLLINWGAYRPVIPKRNVHIRFFSTFAPTFYAAIRSGGQKNPFKGTAQAKLKPLFLNW